MSAVQFLGAIEMGLIYSLVALGVLISFRILDFPDLTADGSFPLGAAIAAIYIIAGGSPLIATLLAAAGGSLAGLMTAWLNVRWKILHLLASILTMTALYSINLRIMGRPNLALLQEKTIFLQFQELTGLNGQPTLFLIAAIVLVIGIGFWRFMVSEAGLALRATGANARMAKAQGISTHKMIYCGMGLSNALIALAGGIFAQSQGFADITMGVGTIVFGLAAVIMGEMILPSRLIAFAVMGTILGSILYRLTISIALSANELGLRASDQNLVIAFLIAAALVISQLRKKRGKIR